MFIIPMEQSVDWKKPPLVTFLLIVINSVVLLSLQNNDKEKLQQAVDYYFGSILPRLELGEFTRYRRDELKGSTLSRTSFDATKNRYLLMEMELDGNFMQRLRDDRIITPKHNKYPAWRKARDHYDALLKEVVYLRHGFIPIEHRPGTFFSHMFLHGDMGHLIGNMIFLLLVGLSLETMLGPIRYTALYLLGGVGAVTLFWCAYADSPVPLVGASGAIAGLMAAYACIYGLRKIRFFYSILFYFDYVKAPAIILLPIWLVNEIYQLFWTEISSIAYVAHIGGLITGAVLSFWFLKSKSGVVDERLEETEQERQRINRYARGLRYLGDLKILQAKQSFTELHEADPEDLETLEQLYKVMKYLADSDDFHITAWRILLLAGHDDRTQQLILRTFRDYMETCKGRIRGKTEHMIALADRLCRMRQPEESERLLQMLWQKSNGDPRGLDRAFLQLAETWKQARKMEKYRECLQIICETFPHTGTAVMAQRLLNG